MDDVRIGGRVWAYSAMPFIVSSTLSLNSSAKVQVLGGVKLRTNLYFDLQLISEHWFALRAAAAASAEGKHVKRRRGKAHARTDGDA